MYVSILPGYVWYRSIRFIWLRRHFLWKKRKLFICSSSEKSVHSFLRHYASSCLASMSARNEIDLLPIYVYKSVALSHVFIHKSPTVLSHLFYHLVNDRPRRYELHSVISHRIASLPTMKHWQARNEVPTYYIELPVSTRSHIALQQWSLYYITS